MENIEIHVTCSVSIYIYRYRCTKSKSKSYFNLDFTLTIYDGKDMRKCNEVAYNAGCVSLTVRVVVMWW